TCSCTARTTASGLCPRFWHAIPPAKSSSSLPSASQTLAPSARVTTRSVVATPRGTRRSRPSRTWAVPCSCSVAMPEAYAARSRRVRACCAQVPPSVYALPDPFLGGLMALLQIGDTAPDFQADTTEGPINFHDWVGDSWAILFSHPKDFTPVCTTELGYMAKIKPEFDKRGVKVIGLSVDPMENHEGWLKDIEETQGIAPNYPIIADHDFNVAQSYGMLSNEVSGDPGSRTPADNQTVRNVFVVGPDKKIKLILVYPMTTGRNFDEVLRVIDSLQLTANHKVSTPVNWQQGEDVIIAGSVSDDEAKEIFGDWESPRPYIRIVPQPREKVEV